MQFPHSCSSLFSVLLYVYCAQGSKQHSLGDKIKKNEMGGAFYKYGRDVRCVQGFGGETRGKETNWKT